MNRSSGVLMHISSLPNFYGIGSLGKEAYKFIDFLNAAKVTLWQILPLNLTSYGDSPYQSVSNYGYNYYFIDLDLLKDKGLLKAEDYQNIDFGNNEERINYKKIFDNRVLVLKKAFKNFQRDKDFYNFLKSNENSRDFAFFMVLKELNNYKCWAEWDEKYSHYSKELEEEIISKYKDLFEFYIWTQYEFLKEYFDLKKYANSKNVKIMGDIPIYLAYDSVECYKYPQMFQFDKNHKPTRVAGCPPDCFSEDGQLWGNPLYNWDYLKRTNYKWWNGRINNALKLYDLVRIDHFRGFSAYFSIPYGDKTARNGSWVKGPGFDLFKDKLDLPIVAEDLGFMDEDFINLMKLVKYPGMKIITQGLMNQNENDSWRPRNYDEHYFSYTSTHDSETTRQYIDELSSTNKQIFINVLSSECAFFNIDFNENLSNYDLTYKIIELNYATNSIVAMTPIQDLLSIGKEGRMNLPSTLSTNNWSYRLDKNLFENRKDELIKFLSNLVSKYHR